MYERLLKETERYLENRKEVVVPVKQVWDAMVKEGRANSFAVPSLMTDFECLLEGDKRFEFVTEKGARVNVESDDDNFFEHEEMEKLGFSDDQKVKLRRIPLSPLDDDEEEGDALDAAVSINELDEELQVQPSFESESRQVGTKPAPQRAATKKASPKISRKPVKKAAKKATKKVAKRKSPTKKRKK